MNNPFGKIRGIASSYLSSPNMMRAKAVAARLAGSRSAMWGMGIGGLAGGTYGIYKSTDDRSRGVRGKIRSLETTMGSTAKWGAIGLGAGAAYGAYKGNSAAMYGGVAKASRWASGVVGRMATRMAG